MITLFYILAFLAIWHFFYEGVLAPALRHSLRYKFFKLRDELRNLKIEEDLSAKDEKIYAIIDNSTCDMINSMSFISIDNYFKLKRDLEKNNVKETDFKKIENLIKNAENSELKRIDKEVTLNGAKALFINNGGLTVYLIIPLMVALLVILFSVQFERLNNLLTKVSARLIYSPDYNSTNIKFC